MMFSNSKMKIFKQEVGEPTCGGLSPPGSPFTLVRCRRHLHFSQAPPVILQQQVQRKAVILNKGKKFRVGLP
jgi:hypothetical protein